jgi:hypothetical protein
MYLKDFIKNYNNDNFETELLKLKDISQIDILDNDDEDFKLTWIIIEKIVKLEKKEFKRLLTNLLSIKQIYLPNILQPKNLELLFSSFETLEIIIKNSLIISNNGDAYLLFDYLIKNYMNNPDFKCAYLKLHLTKLKNQLTIYQLKKQNWCLLKLCCFNYNIKEDIKNRFLINLNLNELFNKD